MSKLTKKQNEILDLIKRFIADHGYPPTVREICKEKNLSSPATVHVHLEKLVEKGMIKKDPAKNRTIELLVENEYKRSDDGTIAVPLLGKVTAGSPIEAIEEPNEYFNLPSYLIPNNKEVFTLLVQGTSMIDAGILDGDIVVVEKQDTARNGEIVVAMTDEYSVTLKTFYKEKGYFRLQPENSEMDPIILDNVTILGKAVGLYIKI